MRLIDRISDWAFSIEPEWLGFTVLLSICFVIVILLLTVCAVLIAITQGWVLLALPAFIAGCWAWAIWGQD